MTVLNPIAITGRVETILVNGEKDGDITTTAIDQLAVTFAGFTGENRHSGLTSLSDVRYRKQYAKDTEIRNTRQITILSQAEMADIAKNLAIPHILPEWLGGNLLVSGIPDLTLIPPSTRLIFSSGAALVVDNENAPCRYPAEQVEMHHQGVGNKFIEAAQHKRGVVAWVEREGIIATHDTIAIHLPPRHIWSHS